MFNPAALSQGVHMCIAAFEAVGFAVAGTHAYLLLKRPSSRLHKEAVKIALSIGAIAALLQPLSETGLRSKLQCVSRRKLAAMESLF